jgi:hypothetical protein
VQRPARSHTPPLPRAFNPRNDVRDPINIEAIRRQATEQAHQEAVDFLRQMNTKVVEEQVFKLEEFEVNVAQTHKLEINASEQNLANTHAELIEAERRRLQMLANEAVANAQRELQSSAQARIMVIEQQVIAAQQENERLRLETASQLREQQVKLELAERRAQEAQIAAHQFVAEAEANALRATEEAERRTNLVQQQIQQSNQQVISTTQQQTVILQAEAAREREQLTSINEQLKYERDLAKRQCAAAAAELSKVNEMAKTKNHHLAIHASHDDRKLCPVGHLHRTR